MKRALSVLCLLASVSANANLVQSVYKPGTPLPKQLQADLIVYLQNHCANYVVPNGLKEISTVVSDLSYDFAPGSEQYLTTFSSAYYDASGNQRLETKLYTSSGRYEDLEGNVKYEILAAYGDGITCN